MRVIGVEHIPLKSAFALEKAVESTRESIAIIGPKASGKTKLLSELFNLIKQNRMLIPQVEDALLFLDGKLEHGERSDYMPTVESDFLYMRTSKNHTIGLYALGSANTGFTHYLYNSILMQPTVHKVVLIHNIDMPLEDTKQFFIKRLSEIKKSLYDKQFILILISKKGQKIDAKMSSKLKEEFSDAINSICNEKRELSIIAINRENNHFENRSLSEFLNRFVVGE